MLTRVRASAPPSTAAWAISTISVEFGLNFAHRGRLTLSVAASTERVIEAEWEKIFPRSSTFGQDTFTSTATI